MPFDVEVTMPRPGGGGGGGATHPPAVSRAIKSVNLMCYLLDDITYRELYTKDFRVILPRIIARIKNLGDPALGTVKLNYGAYGDAAFPIKQHLLDALENRFLAYMNGPKGGRMILGDLFISPAYTKPSVEHEFVDSVVDMYASTTVGGNCELEHFCCPCIAFQDGTFTKPLNLGSYSDFLTHLGDYTMYELFTMQKKRCSSDVVNQLALARNDHILKDSTSSKPFAPTPAAGDSESDEPTVYSFPPGNGYKCSGGICVASADPEHFCNDANGACSAMSYP